MLRKIQVVAIVILLSVIFNLFGGDSSNWPQWRGPGFIGSSESTNYPVKWNHSENLVWKTELPGRASSTPIIWEEHIILTAPIQQEDGVLSLDLSGNKRWEATLGKERSGKHRTASGSNPSPITDGETIFAYFKSGTLAALDFKGNVLWKTNLQEFFGKDNLWWDIGTSPVLTDNYVIGTVMHTGESGLVAFEKKTGKTIWKIRRNYETPLENSDSYTTPLVVDYKGQEIIIVWGAEHVTAYNAKDGDLLWTCSGFNPNQTQNWPTVASPVVIGDILIISYGRGSLLAGIRLGGSGDVTKSHRMWTREGSGGFVPTPAIYDGKVYLLGDRGQLLCVDPETGKTLLEGELPKNRRKYYASPLVVDGKLYAAREDGMVYVTTIEGEFKLLSENPMDEQMIASPVPMAGKIFLRGDKHLFAVK
jgi:outer membrane protein assembly factor BamB